MKLSVLYWLGIWIIFVCGLMLWKDMLINDLKENYVIDSDIVYRYFDWFL